jgi:hypothetical protein
MTRIKKLYFYCIILSLLTGCASLNSNTPFRYQPSLISQTGSIDKVTAIKILLDKRPKEDIAYTKNITDVCEKVTAKLLEDFKASGIFKEIHYPPRAGDEIVISGSIERFTWKLYTMPLGFIPLLGYLGIPTLKGEGVATIVLEVRDAKTDVLIATLRESAKVENYFTVYNFKIGDSGTELEDAFREVGRKLKEGLLTQLNWKR